MTFAAPAYAAARHKLRSLPPNLRRLRIGMLASQQPWRPAPAPASAVRSPLPARASGCSVPLRGTASAGSGRTPFVLTPPLRPGLRRLAFVLPPAVPSPQAPPERPPARFVPARPVSAPFHRSAPFLLASSQKVPRPVSFRAASPSFFFFNGACLHFAHPPRCGAADPLSSFAVPFPDALRLLLRSGRSFEAHRKRLSSEF